MSPLYAYGRPAIAWDLKCDDVSTKNSNNDRASIYQMLKIGGTEDQMGYTSAIASISIALIFFVVCACCTGGFAIFAKHEQIIVCTGLYLVAVITCIVLTAIMVADAPKAVDEKHNQARKMERYDAVNGCSDEYVRLPQGLSSVVEDSVRYIEVIPLLSWIMLALTVVNLFAECGAKWHMTGNMDGFLRGNN